MNWYLVLRFLHIGSAMIFIGGILARQLLRGAAGKTDDVHTFATFYQAAGQIEKGMVIPGNLAVILFGIWLALVEHAPILGFLQGANQNWLLVTNLLLLSAMLVVPLVFVPRGKQFDHLLTQAQSEGRMTPTLRAQLNDPTVRFFHGLELLVLAVVVVLMVFKPF
jgi:uncharacterized membrane protein